MPQGSISIYLYIYMGKLRETMKKLFYKLKENGLFPEFETYEDWEGR